MQTIARIVSFTTVICEQTFVSMSIPGIKFQGNGRNKQSELRIKIFKKKRIAFQSELLWCHTVLSFWAVAILCSPAPSLSGVMPLPPTMIPPNVTCLPLHQSNVVKRPGSYFP